MSMQAVAPAARDGLAAAMRRLHSLLLELAAAEEPGLRLAPDERDGLPRLMEVLGALAECQSRHEQARTALREASRAFERVDAERRMRLLDLQRLLGAAANGPLPPAGGPDLRVVAIRQQGPAQEPERLPALEITCFGGFEVRRGGRPVRLCSNRNGQTILRLLVAQPRHRASMDMLMEALWPEETPDVARHKLHCALSALRRSLNNGCTDRRGGGYLLCRNGMYALNPAVSMRIDVDEFLACHRGGQQAGGSAAIAHYETACALYRGPLLPEDLYADWSRPHRDRLEKTYLLMCDALATHCLAAARPDEAAAWALRILEERPCDEAAHRQLMRASAAAGRRDEAVRQYRRCELLLREELDVQPSHETTTLLRTILRGLDH